jgi:hypothetical protein
MERLEGRREENAYETLRESLIGTSDMVSNNEIGINGLQSEFAPPMSPLKLELLTALLLITALFMKQDLYLLPCSRNSTAYRFLSVPVFADKHYAGMFLQLSLSDVSKKRAG